MLTILFSPHLQQHASTSEAAVIFNNELADVSSHERRHLIPKSRRHHSKRQRVDLSYIDEEPFLPRETLGFGFGNAFDRQAHNTTDRIAEERKAKIDLSPCHICRRKPTIKAELDAFANCEGCSKRTCYICIRACPGMALEMACITEGDYDALALSFHAEEQHMDFGSRATIDDISSMDMAWEKRRMPGHRRRICSRCCVEKGEDGEVWCLGCLRTVEVG